jgi:putative ABC transport system permease protein
MPDWKQEINERLAGLNLEPTREAAIVEELAQYLDDHYAELLAGAATEAEAERRTLAELSGSEMLERELRREERQVPQEFIVLGTNRRTEMIADLWQDLRYGARRLAQQPGFTLVAVLTLALGIGANTAIFSVVNAVLLQPLPFQEPGRLARIWRASAEDERGACSYPDFADLRARQTVFERMAAWRGGDYALTGKGEPVTLRGVVVTADLFPLLGAAPQLGRNFTTAEDQAGNRAAILSHSLWRQRFNADPNVLGQSISINSRSYDVVGVMPAGFAFPVQNAAVDLWLSLSTVAVTEGGAPLTVQRGSLSFSVIARLKPNVSPAQAEAGLRVIVDELAKQYPESKDFIRARVVPFHQEVTRDVRPGLLLLLGAAGCVLLIACANVATLLMARATTRRKEMAIRAALGAGRWRIVRQMLTESLLLALCGGAAGWLLARWGTAALLALKPGGLPRALAAGVDARVLGFTVLAALSTGVLFGLAPAWQAAKTDLNETLKDGAKGGADGARRNRLRHALVVAEVALAFVLLVCSGLLLNSFLRLRRVNPGFDPHNVLTFRIALPASRYAQLTQVAPFYQKLIAQLETLPGVKSVSAISHLPLSANRGMTGFSIEGVATPPDDPVPYPTDIRFVTPAYFQTMGMQLVKGRDFNARDELRATQVAIINETLARRYFPNRNPLGKRIRPGYAIDERGWLMREIVGVASDSKHVSLREAAPPTVYLPHSQIPRHAMTMVIRAANDPHGLIGAVQNEAHALDREAPVSNVKTLDEYLGAAVAEPKFDTMLLGLFAGLALLLTSVGLYGVMAYIGAQRTREFGIRMALGAQSRDVLRLVIRQGMGPALLGAAIGVAGAVALTRAMKSWLFGVGPTDPLTFAAAPLLLVGVALVACYIPARRATKVDPLVALRHD